MMYHQQNVNLHNNSVRTGGSSPHRVSSYNCNHFFILCSKLTFVIDVADRYLLVPNLTHLGSLRVHFVIVVSLCAAICNHILSFFATVGFSGRLPS